MRSFNIPEINSGLDIFGDIHTHVDELEQMLQRLGYRKQKRHGIYGHPNGRKAFFLGDLLDRGPKIRETVRTVRAMVEAGEALMILGNHGMNALRFHHIVQGQPLRAHYGSKLRQHQQTLDQFANPYPEEWFKTLDWMPELPLAVDLGPLRFVHACWDWSSISRLVDHVPLRGENLERLSRKDSSGANAIERILNGPEAHLPEGHEQVSLMARGGRKSGFAGGRATPVRSVGSGSFRPIRRFPISPRFRRPFRKADPMATKSRFCFSVTMPSPARPLVPSGPTSPALITASAKEGTSWPPAGTGKRPCIPTISFN
ncbi:MAG: metallophosphoesterase [Opitutales bacterium]|nr:metallophosphoesterase [Opitutales bacterium]